MSYVGTSCRVITCDDTLIHDRCLKCARHCECSPKFGTVEQQRLDAELREWARVAPIYQSISRFSTLIEDLSKEILDGGKYVDTFIIKGRLIAWSSILQHLISTL
jgi:hypothetical protein